MARRKTLSDLTAASAKRRSKKRNTVRVNGENINRVTQPEAYQIAVGLRDSGISTNDNDSLNKKAKLLLEEVCEFSMAYDEDFSLIESCTETEDTLILAEDKFPDSADQFYNLDGDQMSRAAAEEYKKQEEAVETDIVSFTVNLLDNTNGKSTTNGQTTTNGKTTTNAVSTKTANVGTTTTKTTTTSY